MPEITKYCVFVCVDVVAHCNSLTWKAYRLERSDMTADVTHVDHSKRLQLYLSDVFNYVRDANLMS